MVTSKTEVHHELFWSTKYSEISLDATMDGGHNTPMSHDVRLVDSFLSLAGEETEIADEEIIARDTMLFSLYQKNVREKAALKKEMKAMVHRYSSISSDDIWKIMKSVHGAIFKEEAKESELRNSPEPKIDTIVKQHNKPLTPDQKEKHQQWREKRIERRLNKESARLNRETASRVKATNDEERLKLRRLKNKKLAQASRDRKKAEKEQMEKDLGLALQYIPQNAGIDLQGILMRMNERQKGRSVFKKSEK